MLISQSSVKIVDNTGVRQVYLIVDSGKTIQVGGVSTAVVKSVRSISSIK
tara:strand:+ start:4193 stop:4342 length:150 start_codon:yes stop_codon:yes gene_type:complete